MLAFRRLPLGLSLLLLANQSASGQHRRDARIFDLLPSDADVAFSIPFMFSHVTGRFDRLGGTLLYSPSELERSVVVAVIDATSINTGHQSRDAHLRTSDFFDVATYPTIIFEGLETRSANASRLLVGSLTMHGVTRSVALTMSSTHPPAWDSTHAGIWLGFRATGRINRRDYGIVGSSENNSWFDAARQRTVPNSVSIDIRLDATRVDYSRRHDPAIDSVIARVRQSGAHAAVADLRRLRAAGSPQTETESRLDRIGLALIDLGKVGDAIALLALLAELDTAHSRPHALLAFAYYCASRDDLARAQATRSIALDSNDTVARAVLRALTAR